MANRRKRNYLPEGLFVLLILSAYIRFGLATVSPTSPTESSLSSSSSSLHGFTTYTKGHTSKLSSTVATVPFSTISHKAKTSTPKHGMLESVVIPSSNSEREAQEIYDKALKQYDSYGVSTRKICTTWEQRGCQCSGTVDELNLSCRGIGLNETPIDLPKNLIKL